MWKMGDASWTDLVGFVLKLNGAEMNTETQKSGPSWKNSSQEPWLEFNQRWIYLSE